MQRAGVVTVFYLVINSIYKILYLIQTSRLKKVAQPRFFNQLVYILKSLQEQLLVFYIASQTNHYLARKSKIKFDCVLEVISHEYSIKYAFSFFFAS